MYTSMTAGTVYKLIPGGNTASIVDKPGEVVHDQEDGGTHVHPELLALIIVSSLVGFVVVLMFICCICAKYRSMTFWCKNRSYVSLYKLHVLLDQAKKNGDLALQKKLTKKLLSAKQCPCLNYKQCAVCKWALQRGRNAMNGLAHDEDDNTTWALCGIPCMWRSDVATKCESCGKRGGWCECGKCTLCLQNVKCCACGDCKMCGKRDCSHCINCRMDCGECKDEDNCGVESETSSEEEIYGNDGSQKSLMKPTKIQYKKGNKGNSKGNGKKKRNNKKKTSTTNDGDE
jgi:hypothetical protein